MRRSRVGRARLSRLGTVPISGLEIGEAARTIFGSREEMRATFAEWEAAMVETMHKAVEQARKPRPAE